MWSKDSEITVRSREREVMLLKLPGFLKNEQSPWLFQHLKVCFSKVINISFVLSFQRLSSLWDVDLVFMLESPYQASRNHFSKVLLSGTEFLGDQAHSWPPLHITDFFEVKCSLWCPWFWPRCQKSLRYWCVQQLSSLWPQLPPFTLSAHKKDVKPNKDM